MSDLAFPTACPAGAGLWPMRRNISSLTRAPWTLAPAGAIFLVVLVTNLLLDPAKSDDPAGPPRTG